MVTKTLSRMKSQKIYQETMKNIFYGLTFFMVVSVLLSCQKPIEKDLSLLTFNIWQEGTSVDNGVEKIKDVILEINPDVVCFVEVRNYNDRNWTEMIAGLLWEEIQYFTGYIGTDVSFLSKYPLDNGKVIFHDDGSIVKFDVHLNDHKVIVAGAHLDYTYYASNLPRGYNGGDPDWKIIDDGTGNANPVIDIDLIQAYNLRSKRDEAISSFISFIDTIQDPVILMGDFNEPSWLDWTHKTRNLYDHNGVEFKWPTTEKLFKQGFTDVYRSFYPDESIHPGFTWPAFIEGHPSTSWSPLADERDRIDYIFFKGDQISVLDVSIAGPKGSYAYNIPDTASINSEKFVASHLPWPSDHKAVFTNLRLKLDP